MKSVRSFVCAIFSVAMACSVSSADVPRIIHYQGKLLDSAGVPVAGTVTLRVRIYDDPAAATTPLLDETHAGVTLTRGLFSVLIGSNSGGVPDSALVPSAVYLGVTVGGGAELSPRTRLTTAPYGVKSRAAETLVIPGGMTAAVTVDGSGNVGVGTASPAAKLHVAGGVRIADGTQGAGKVLTSDANGTATWQTASSGENPLLFFGDGADGDVTISSDTTLDRDWYYNNLTINNGVTLFPNGYRIFVKNSMTLNGTISRNGNSGSNGNTTSNTAGGTGGAGAAALPDGYLKGSGPGGAGQNGFANLSGGGGSGTAGTSVTSALGTTNGAAGGHGGSAQPGNLDGGNGGAGGTTTAATVKLITNWHLLTLLDIASSGATAKYTSSGTGGGGGGGSGNISGQNGGGGGGGGGGGNGGIIAVYAKNLIINATGLIQSNGGNGGNGAMGRAGSNCGVGGGGGGGNGGIIILVYTTLTNNGTLQTLGGAGGLKGPPGTNGTTTAAADGSPGFAGAVRQFQLTQ